MKKLCFTLVILFVGLHSFGQSPCDSLACYSYASPNTFKVLNNAGESYSESLDTTGVNDAIMTCELLCYIESERRPYDDVILKKDGLVILVYSEDKITIEGTTENE